MNPTAKHLITSTLVLASPGLGVIVLLMALDQLRIGTGIIAIMVIVIAGLALLFRPIQQLRGYTRQIEALTRRPPVVTDSPITPATPGPVSDVAASLQRLEHSWARDRADLHNGLLAAQTLFDALPDPLLTLDGQARFISVNAAARELLLGKRGEEDLTGRDLSAVIRQPSLLGSVADVLAGEAMRSVEFTLTDRVDQTFEARIEAVHTDRVDTRAARALILMRDVTAIRRGERLRADFVANVSHELRTPLTSLVGFIETLRGPALGDAEAQARFLNLMEIQSNRMTRIVNDLLSLSRIEMNEHTVPSDDVLLQPAIATVADLLAPQAEAQNVTIELQLDALEHPVIGQVDELAQMFQNLIENAIKYGGEGSTVRVSATVADSMACISVIDQGEGIAREHLPRLTERFYRVDTARSRELGGTGLGLAIVKHIANRHRGELTIESESGQGSTFTVTLPMAAAEPR
ncbi:MAG: ATP-binding protein [Alphaproteobacteria bacterium]